MKILFISEYLPSPKSNGGEIATANFVAALQQLGHDVTVIGHKRDGDFYKNHEHWEIPIGIMTIETAFAKKSTVLHWFLKALLFSLPVTSAKYITTKLVHFIKNNKHFELVVLNHTQLFYLSRYLPDIPVISCIHNYESSIYLDNAKQAKSILKKIFFYREGFLLKKIENKIKNKASDIWALNTNDLKPFSGKGTVFIPYSFQSIITRNENDYSYDIGILGMWTWKPNYEAIIWFLKEVVPLLDKNIKIAIGGKGLPESFNFRENVLPLGFIPDAHIFFSQCRMIAIPSLHDIGIQIKSIDALSLGIPVVGTDIAFRNIEPLPEYAFAAKTCIDFANHICSILKNGNQTVTKTWNKERKHRFVALLKERLSSI